MADLELLPAAPAAPAAKSLSDDEVLAHTAALWKYQDIPQSEPEPFPEYMQQETDLPDGRVIAARVRGKQHKHDGSNCDDWYEVANLDGITLLAVADGAGSKKFSRIGARESCRAALGYLLHNLAQDKPVDTNDTAQLTNRLAGLVQQAVLRAYGAVEAAFYTRVADWHIPLCWGVICSLRISRPHCCWPWWFRFRLSAKIVWLCRVRLAMV